MAARFWTCRSTRARVGAERIETLVQLAAARADGIDRGQGFLLGVPRADVCTGPRDGGPVTACRAGGALRCPNFP
ncbi:hypothetical protein I6A60_01470 [Frankia sp. AgB1.9]|uniref:hypothetical protein n=1 Tax=unclassified Frankia TaxID=2632575 RepID=UPI001932FFDC|nr:MULTISPECIES: hypothetical protein [unclassified Frankia]MBL7488763.1 hypothetical protein [Frankia sp. AgW1.1]MBL7546556.1 hypothetical protein [Frankia sp. AgB1.9]MBL7625074.1 hypothetical protein [Frankia sp. AgB1.8]